MFFSEFISCPEHGISIPEIEPRSFSFNTPHGACPACQGLGMRLEIDPNLIIPDNSKSINEGAIAVLEWNNSRFDNGYYWQQLLQVASAYDIDLDMPVSKIPNDKMKIILYGSNGASLNMVLTGRNDRKSTYRAPFEGVIPNLERRYNETNSDYIRDRIAEFMKETPCQVCHGKRLKPESLAVTILGKISSMLPRCRSIRLCNGPRIYMKNPIVDGPSENHCGKGIKRDYFTTDFLVMSVWITLHFNVPRQVFRAERRNAFGWRLKSDLN